MECLPEKQRSFENAPTAVCLGQTARESDPSSHIPAPPCWRDSPRALKYALQPHSKTGGNSAQCRLPGATWLSRATGPVITPSVSIHCFKGTPEELSWSPERIDSVLARWFGLFNPSWKRAYGNESCVIYDQVQKGTPSCFGLMDVLSSRSG